MSLYLTLLYGFCSIIMLLFGILALCNNYKARSNQVFFLFLLSTIFWMFFVYFGYFFVDPNNLNKSLFFFRYAYGFSIFLPFFALTFFYYFPRPTIIFSKYIKLFIIIFTIFLFFVSAFTPLVETSLIFKNEVLVDILGPLYLLYTIYFIFYLILSAVLALKKRNEGIEKKKLLFATFGLLSFIFLTVMTNVVLPILGIVILVQESPVFTLFFLIPAFYAIQKYRFFNFTNTLINLIRKIVLLGVFLLTVTAIFNIFLVFFPKVNLILNILISSTIAIFAYKALEKMFPEFISKEFFKFRDVMKELRLKMYYCENYKSLQDHLDKIFVSKLNIDSVKIFAVMDKNEKRKSLDYIPVYNEDEFSEELKKYQNDLLIAEEIEFRKIPIAIKEILRSGMEKLGVALCMPLFMEGQLIGFLVLGNREKNKIYNQEEINEILEIRPYLEICFMNILIKTKRQGENNILKTIVDEKTQDIKEQCDEIKKLLTQQSDFIAVSAHELRTPLTVAMNQLEDSLGHKKTPNERLKDMKVIKKYLDMLKHTMQSLFDIQQFDLEKMQAKKERLNLKDCIKEIYKGFQHMMKSKSLKFSLEDSIKQNVFVNVDKAQICQVINNLINNAIKFNKKGNKIILRIEDAENKFLIKVIDNGDGVKDIDKERIFEKFQTKKASINMGFGLGLYICKKIVELHQARIWVEDTPGGGATFCVELEKM